METPDQRSCAVLLQSLKNAATAKTGFPQLFSLLLIYTLDRME